MNNDKFQFSSVAKWVIGLLITALVVFLVWYFRFLVGCVLVALVLAFGSANSKVSFQNTLQTILYRQNHFGNHHSDFVYLGFRDAFPLACSPDNIAGNDICKPRCI